MEPDLAAGYLLNVTDHLRGRDSLVAAIPADQAAVLVQGGRHFLVGFADSCHILFQCHGGILECRSRICQEGS